jgi:hypothetical protein
MEKNWRVKSKIIFQYIRKLRSQSEFQGEIGLSKKWLLVWLMCGRVCRLSLPLMNQVAMLWAVSGEIYVARNWRQLLADSEQNEAQGTESAKKWFLPLTKEANLEADIPPFKSSDETSALADILVSSSWETLNQRMLFSSVQISRARLLTHWHWEIMSH